MFEYKPTASGLRFHESDESIKMIMGPFGSGKSTIAAMDILYNAMAQPAAPDGTRYSRWGVIRASYPNLGQTTRRTILEVMPEGTGYVTTGNFPLKGAFRFQLPDGTSVQAEFELWSALTGDDAQKFKSANWTGAWLNEATEVDYGVMMMAKSRAGRFPSSHLGGCRWAGVIADFNRPPKGHWIEGLFGRPSLVLPGASGQPEEFPMLSITQPPAAFKREEDGASAYEPNPDAENLDNLRGGLGYYKEQIAMLLQAGRTDEIESLYCLLDAASKQGRPVWPMFDMKKHVAHSKIDPLDGVPVVIGYDSSGIHQAAVFLQYQGGKWCVLDELYGDQEGFAVFVPGGLMPLARGRYAKCETIVVYDPAEARDFHMGLAPSVHLREAGFRTAPRVTNKISARVAAVATMLNIDRGGLLVSPHCEMLVDAMRGGDGKAGYHYAKRRIRGSLDSVYAEEPEKNEASHLADSLQYACLHITREREADELTPEAWRLKNRLSKRGDVLRRLMPA